MYFRRWFPAVFSLIVFAQAAGALPFLEPVPISQNAIALHWSEISDNALLIKLYRDESLIGEFPATSRSFRDQKVLPGTRYTYRVTEQLPDGKLQSVTETVTSLRQVLPNRHYQLVIVGGTASGVGAAISASRLGVRVALIEPSDSLGGMITSGVSVTDIRKPARSNGLFEELRLRVQSYYGTGNGLSYEPKVSWNLLRKLVDEQPLIDVYHRMSYVSTSKQGRTVTSVTCRDLGTATLTRFTADQFIDATVEGDMLNKLGVANRVGREARSEEEPHAGFIHYDRFNDVIAPLSTGNADNNIQAYSFLLPLKDYGTAADRSIPKPPFYDKANYEHTTAWKETWAYMYGRFPNGKFEMNQHPQGNDLQEINFNYPWMSNSQRGDMTDRFRWHALGYLYYLQTEQGLKRLGLADDEYPENGNIPTSLYVREVRRMEADFMQNESDVANARKRLRPDTVGIGDYPMDSHAVHKKTDWSNTDLGEGEYWLYRQTPWYQIPFGVMVPRELDNLMVTSAVSATHVGYGTLRMEPVRMAMGQAAGTAIGIALGAGIHPSDVPLGTLQRRLVNSGVYMGWFSDVTAVTPRFWAIQELAAKAVLTDEELKPQMPLSYEDMIRWLYKAMGFGYTLHDRGYIQPKEDIMSQQESQLMSLFTGPILKSDSYTAAQILPIMREAAKAKGLSAKATDWAMRPLQTAEGAITREQFITSMALILRRTNSGAIAASK